MFEGLTIASLPCSEVPLYLRPNINFYFLNIFLHNRRQFSVEVLMINGILVYVSVCLWAAELLGSLSSLVELVKLFIILFSDDSTQNKLGLTQVFHFGTC